MTFVLTPPNDDSGFVRTDGSGAAASLRVAAFDLEINPEMGECLDMGAVDTEEGCYHGCVAARFRAFLRGADVVGGHNVVDCDMRVCARLFDGLSAPVFDTLRLETLLRPLARRHALEKEEGPLPGVRSNPLSDAEASLKLLIDLIDDWRALPEDVRRILTELLADEPGFSGFFAVLGLGAEGVVDLAGEIRRVFSGKLCASAPIEAFLEGNRAAFGCVLGFIAVSEANHAAFPATPLWLSHRFPETDRMVEALRGTLCRNPECEYCRRRADLTTALKEFFGYSSFRVYEGDRESLQEAAAAAAVAGESLLAIFPTGGGKSLTFQLPALMAARATAGLTVVLSPLQSLMKDQVDNLEKKEIFAAVTINGLVNLLERKEAFEEIESGRASLLYISPEALRSASIVRALEKRRVERFVIDEAHCFSAWGHDFRVDYLYIGEFLREFQERLGRRIPVSCFTATAKAKVVQDICDYFERTVGVHLKVFRTSAVRKNLEYQIKHFDDNDGKYAYMRSLIESRACPTIVYTDRVRTTEELAEKLTKDGFPALPYNGKMDPEVKIRNQNAFLNDEVKIMVATTAFGMGVDKEDVQLVIHHDISSSLENYVQESGRAGRKAELRAECYILFNEEDINRHFSLLSATKLTLSDVQQVWNAVKRLSAGRREFAVTDLEIAREAGWDCDAEQIKTKITAAIGALEKAGFVKRGSNTGRVYATGLRGKSFLDGQKRIEADWARGEASVFRCEGERVEAERVLQSLVSRSLTGAAVGAVKADDKKSVEARVDYIADRLGLETRAVVRAVTNLRTLGILTDERDMRASLSGTPETLERRLSRLADLERRILAFVEESRHPEWGNGDVVSLVEMNAALEDAVGKTVGLPVIERLLRSLRQAALVEIERTGSKKHWRIRLKKTREKALERIEKLAAVGGRAIGTLGGLERNRAAHAEERTDKGDDARRTVSFSFAELLREVNDSSGLFQEKTTSDELEKSLLFLHRNGLLCVDGGFFVAYLPMRIERLEADNRKKYLQKHYDFLDDYYKERIQQIHIVGEYANLMVRDREAAQRYVRDYFELPYETFLKTYFKGGREEELKRSMTPALYEKLIGTLSEAQKEILFSEAPYIVVAAGPGSGKTRVLVHKLAHLMLAENVRPEQLVMLTFSRAAAQEFKTRLIALYGKGARFVTVKTFHSFAFGLLGRPGSIEEATDAVARAVRAIREGRADPLNLAATALVLDEAQDMDADEFELVKALIERNPEMRVLAVGDDDQNIYGFRGSDSKYFASLKSGSDYDAEWHELVDNWRSLPAIVRTANRYARYLKGRLKTHENRSVREGAGEVRIVHYVSENLETAVVEAVLAEKRRGTTAVLAHTNREVETIASLLCEAGVPVELVRSDKSFRVGNLLEVQILTNALRKSKKPLYGAKIWAEAQEELRRWCAGSPWVEPVIAFARRFRKTAPGDVYASDWEEAAAESRLEDLYPEEVRAVVVSTYHGAKGREFNRVHCLVRPDRLKRMPGGLSPAEAQKRLGDVHRSLYVALTRAKDALTVHTTGDFLRHFEAEGVKRLRDEKKYPEPKRMLLRMGLSDVWLDHFKDVKIRILAELTAGDELRVVRGGRTKFFAGGFCCAKASAKFDQMLSKKLQAGYEIESAAVWAVVRRDVPDEDRSDAVVLPVLTLHRIESGSER